MYTSDGTMCNGIGAAWPNCRQGAAEGSHPYGQKGGNISRGGRGGGSGKQGSKHAPCGKTGAAEPPHVGAHPIVRPRAGITSSTKVTQVAPVSPAPLVTPVFKSKILDCKHLLCETFITFCYRKCNSCILVCLSSTDGFYHTEILRNNQ